MPRVSRLHLRPLDFGGESLGQRVARLRKERGYTQTELADNVGILQNIVSAIECDRLKLSAEMAIRFALALDVTTDELLQSSSKPKNGRKASRRVLRRLEQVESLPRTQQVTLLRTIDTFLKLNAAR
jgi:transcriptional regulator with XRE-family HTH domain